jgi:hypothetical protein
VHKKLSGKCNLSFYFLEDFLELKQFSNFNMTEKKIIYKEEVKKL